MAEEDVERGVETDLPTVPVDYAPGCGGGRVVGGDAGRRDAEPAYLELVHGAHHLAELGAGVLQGGGRRRCCI